MALTIAMTVSILVDSLGVGGLLDWNITFKSLLCFFSPVRRPCTEISCSPRFELAPRDRFCAATSSRARPQSRRQGEWAPQNSSGESEGRNPSHVLVPICSKRFGVTLIPRDDREVADAEPSNLSLTCREGRGRLIAISRALHLSQLAARSAQTRSAQARSSCSSPSYRGKEDRPGSLQTRGEGCGGGEAMSAPRLAPDIPVAGSRAEVVVPAERPSAISAGPGKSCSTT